MTTQRDNQSKINEGQGNKGSRENEKYSSQGQDQGQGNARKMSDQDNKRSVSGRQDDNER